MSHSFINPLAPRGHNIVNAASSIKEWTRAALSLDDSDIVSVNELACHLPGCPPKEAVILVMSGSGSVRKISIHKAIVDVRACDLCAALEVSQP
ncbi:hypothetical protein FJU08_22240 [Martelella alba]|uniref:Nitrate reductase n=1 Tax=Martelella alba TaxID=2590451 RepID=A0A506U3G1_9HYPH|nr:hypothetical protein [Martelella alba]TPW26427.1 hypothetical protein FJU08_22240 [Martelella alba]